MLCCCEKPEVKTLSKPLLTESKSVTGEPKTLPERRPTGFESLPEKSQPKSIPIPAKSVPVTDKLDLAYSSPALLPAPIYAKSEIQMKPEPIELKSIPKTPAELIPKEVVSVIPPVIPKEVIGVPVIPKEVVSVIPPVIPKEVIGVPVIPKEVIAPVILKEVIAPVIPKEVITEVKPVESKPVQKKNSKSNKRI